MTQTTPVLWCIAKHGSPVWLLVEWEWGLYGLAYSAVARH